MVSFHHDNWVIHVEEELPRQSNYSTGCHDTWHLDGNLVSVHSIQYHSHSGLFLLFSRWSVDIPIHIINEWMICLHNLSLVLCWPTPLLIHSFPSQPLISSHPLLHSSTPLLIYSSTPPSPLHHFLHPIIHSPRWSAHSALPFLPLSPMIIHHTSKSAK